MEEALDYPWLDVEHHLRSWRGGKGDVKDSFTPCSLAVSSAASLSLAQILFVSFNGVRMEACPGGDTSRTP